MSDREVEAAIRQRVDLVNTRVDRYERMRKFAVISNDFPEELRSITTSEKIKIDRQAIEDGYRAKIESDLLQRPVPIEARLRQNLLDTATSAEGYTHEDLPGLFG